MLYETLLSEYHSLREHLKPLNDIPDADYWPKQKEFVKNLTQYFKEVDLQELRKEQIIQCAVWQRRYQPIQHFQFLMKFHE